MAETELYNKYRPTKFEDILGNDLAIKSVKSELEHGSHCFLMTGVGGCGKAQPLDTVIPTPDGYRKFGDLKIGDYVFGRNGKPVKVIGVYNRGELDSYQVELSDGRKTICNDDHLWSVFTSKGNFKTLTLREMIDSGIEIVKSNKKYHNYAIPTNGAIEYFNQSKLPVDPYVIGSFIGNGSNTEKYLTLSSNDEFNVSECARLLGFNYKKRSEFNYSWDFSNLSHRILTADVFGEFATDIMVKSHEKRIPEIYKKSTIENRYKLIQGLFDTDGSVSKGFRHNVTYTTTSKGLADDIREVLWSLGIGSSMTLDHRERNRFERDYYEIHVKMYNKDKHTVFRTPVKISRITGNHATKKRYDRIQIVSVVNLNKKVPMRCIKVDCEDELYLTNDFIVTHNTTIARIIAHEVGASEFNIHEINSSSNTGIDTVREIEEQIRYAPVDGTPIVYILDEFHRQSAQAQDACLKMLEECPSYCYFFICTTDPQKICKPLKTRCSEINMKPLDDEDMFKLLKSVARQEGIKCNPDVYRKIAEQSEGSSRMALKKLGSVLYLESDEERIEYLSKSVAEENEDAIEICRMLIKGAKFDSVVAQMNKCKEDIANNPESIRQLIISYAYSVLMKGYNEKATAMIQAFGQADTYRNGKSAIMIGLLDFYSVLN